ncbi:gliding motility-associated C-terminal domain-containing protein [Flavobacterium sp.]|uniref:gliding motility-associated C-terminal domain-containing protein n=1 Tax=Flavobacterium sp. TaxID=239 RepID=UPI0039E3F004
MIRTLLLKVMVIGFLFWGGSGWAQLDPFTLQVTPVTESCTANGTLNFEVSNTTPGATILYRVYHLPDVTTPIAVTPLSSFTGLVAGNYRTIATQSLGNLSNTQQQDAVVTNTIDPLDYYATGQAEVCGNDGRIFIHVTEGNPVSYEIFSGPVTRPLQTSNVFDNLPGGSYMLRVFDDCGEGVAQNFTLNSYGSQITIGNGYVEHSGCNNFILHPTYYAPSGNTLAYPMTGTITVFPPTGPPLTFPSLNWPTIPAIYTQPYTYNISITNACGETYVRNNIPIVGSPLNPQVNWGLQQVGCSGLRLVLSTDDMVGAVTYTFTNAPAGFNPLMFNPNYPNAVTFYNPNVPLPNGSYTVTATDSCGHTDSTTFTISHTPPAPGDITYWNRPGCQIGYGSLLIYGQDTITNIVLVSAPAAFTTVALPHDYTSQMTGHYFYFGSVPAGNYVFKTIDGCGVEVFTTIPVIGYMVGATTATITENCSSFTFHLEHITNYGQSDFQYYLQKWFPQTNQWGHPATGNPGVPNVFDYNNGIGFYNYSNLNVEYSGTFRVVKVLQPYVTGSQTPLKCPFVIYTFEYSVGPKITDVYSFVCENGTYDAVVIAQGYAPLTYRITSKNGQPFFVNNGASSVFLGLQPAIYNFQIEDGCGNILNSLFDISNPSVLDVTAAGFCPEQNASLTVPVFPFLSYQWWNSNNPSVILSTQNHLNFPNFNPAISNGNYQVRIYYEGNPNSCIDFTQDYAINVNPTIPNAGQGQNQSYCGNQGTIDLFELLSGGFDTTGTWIETTASGALEGHLWDSSAVAVGSYQFQYTVNGACGVFDQSTVNITIKPQPDAPLASFEAPVCDAGTLQLLASDISFGTYQWAGPNGFESHEQNPVIEHLSAIHNGIYTVKSAHNGCQSESSSVEITVGTLPQLTLESGCENNRFKLRAVPRENSFDPSTVTYDWTGPNQFTASENPIDITRATSGNYQVTVITAEGCSATASVNISSTFCSVPPGISPNGDHKNDVLDLTGMEVLQFKVFNRYGRMVFEQDNYTNQWHGQDLNGRELPDATYFYYISQKTGEEKTGWVYVTR